MRRMSGASLFVYYTKVRNSFVSYLDSQQTSKAVTKMAARNTSSHNELWIISQQKASLLARRSTIRGTTLPVHRATEKTFLNICLLCFLFLPRIGVKAASAPHTFREMASGGRICARSRSVWSLVTNASGGCYLKGRTKKVWRAEARHFKCSELRMMRNISHWLGDCTV